MAIAVATQNAGSSRLNRLVKNFPGPSRIADRVTRAPVSIMNTATPTKERCWLSSAGSIKTP